jgi:hypothetical protein
MMKLTMEWEKNCLNWPVDENLLGDRVVEERCMLYAVSESENYCLLMVPPLLQRESNGEPI